MSSTAPRQSARKRGIVPGDVVTVGHFEPVWLNSVPDDNRILCHQDDMKDSRALVVAVCDMHWGLPSDHVTTLIIICESGIGYIAEHCVRRTKFNVDRTPPPGAGDPK